VKTAKRWLAVLLLVVGLGACGDNPGPSDGDPGSNQGTDSDGGLYN
jgi:hypothetical protein